MTSPLPPALAALRALAAAAIASSEKPTRLDDFVPEDFGLPDSEDGPFQGAQFFWPWAQYIAAALNQIPRLLDAVEAHERFIQKVAYDGAGAAEARAHLAGGKE